MQTTCPEWCTGSCASSGRCVGEWTSVASTDGVGTVRFRRTTLGIEVQAGRILASPVHVDMAGARLMYTALGRAIHATR